MTNEVGSEALRLPVDKRPPTAAQFYMTTGGTAAIRDDAQPLRSKRYLATMTLHAEG
ncbi:hypothetical protein [Clavibacter lycopersici]|nr:hypothetical protein [Clavibacter lycopersici]